MKRLIALMMCAVSIGMMPNSLSAQDTPPCLGIELIQTDLVVTCDDEVVLQSLTGPLLWNQDLFSDSLLVSSSGLVEVQEVALDLSLVDLGEEFGYLNLGNGFNNLTFPVSIAARFSIPEGHDDFLLFATDEGFGYSGISLSLNQSQGWFETFIGDGSGGGPSQRRSKKSYCSLSVDTLYTVVAVIRGATDHTVYLDGVELGGDYSGSGNGQIVDLGRPATMGYRVPDSGPLSGQELSSTMKFDFFGVYDFELQSSDIVNAGSCDSDSSSALVRPSGAVGWYDFDEAEPFADSEGNQGPIQAVGDVQADVTFCLCAGIEQVEVQLLDCEYAEFLCGEGTTWDVASQSCIVANPSDSNFDGCVQLNDLLDLLSAYGDCGADESPWQCGDPLEYQGCDYETVQIGEQCWFAENLRAENYRNGDAIETLAGNTSEDCSTYYGGEGLVAAYGATWGCSGACDEPFNPCADFETALNAFGRHYNGVAVQDERELCPSGWHPSTDEEWMELELLSGMTQADVQTFGWRGDVASTLKSSDLWCDDTSGTNEWGFAARPGGIIGDDCGYAFEALGIGSWWTHSASGDVGRRSLSAADDRIYRDYALNTEGMMSIRCIKDSE